ncbi:hypothetical protein JQ557_16480 [Bradyrhizobium sp. U87765 SZCCT0131]|uniref:hypothetical protein n=1 Tax=unclassified Bradyrhizobium TaxID=2631580 RepID=UPI001BA4B892|nr:MULTISPECIES: hypothetical protein [unclassified Bradyrhizobium]MBR1219604.1 hypothetical protein [Bradyrhizobium sp. U87765 SZCCT0131]MBR1262255.1 hypothetical protein [Bradyrhizobium sp. U87765 SZCCT0134]MBR1308562.1 hypothetical protein [Bradyrhizobium sp. U87765 SZCCT0110]MBR1318037.1 hypothetical protein [Bradyrhizobium sp. U87765 SZCCT0109]MBR1351740.1 hypothetical protein [Bradyrhizobium sp. U87765 SZCCT0048]
MRRALVIPALLALASLAFLASVATAPAHADGSVSSLRKPDGRPMGMGARRGEMQLFDEVIAKYNASGERFRIDSHCQSACTMFLSIRNVCVTPGATLLFHAGGTQAAGISVAATQHMLSAYNAALRQYVTDNHFMDTFEFHPISGRDIVKRFGYPACR